MIHLINATAAKNTVEFVMNVMTLITNWVHFDKVTVLICRRVACTNNSCTLLHYSLGFICFSCFIWFFCLLYCFLGFILFFVFYIVLFVCRSIKMPERDEAKEIERKLKTEKALETQVGHLSDK